MIWSQNERGETVLALLHILYTLLHFLSVKGQICEIPFLKRRIV